MESTALFANPIVKQDTQPESDTVVLWIDTSGGTNTTKVRDNEGNWNSVVPNFPIFATQETVSFGETNVDTDEKFIDGGALSLPNPPFTDSFDTVDMGSYTGTTLFRLTPEKECDITFHTNPNSAWNDSGAYIERDGGVQKNFAAGDDVTFTNVPGNEQSLFYLSTEGQIYGVEDYLINLPFISQDNPSDLPGIDGITVDMVVTDETVTVEFTSIPEDITAWDRVSWQSQNEDGSITSIIETNDGGGWEEYATNVAPPYSIASIPTSEDIRLKFNLSRPNTNDTSPLISYVARRGER
jgi:hypothetical protein